ncbi:MAG: glycerophosphodiester phosphodiesterase [Aquificae bacterium]|nr:glycerophosphodiester phosphodiesterase [Aquificota bacterium]
MEILQKLTRKPFSIVGHRGAKGVKPENTIASLKYAIEHGADIVEIDVRKTKDRQLILLHDPDFRRLAGKAVSPRDVDYSFIKEHITIQGEPVPTLEEAIKFVNARVGMFIEIKEPDTVEKVLTILQKYNALEWTAVISFYDTAIKTAKKLLPSITTGLIYSKPPGRIKEAHLLEAQIVLPYYKLATLKANNFAHSLGLKVVAWTINDEKLALKILKNRTDALATDYPHKLSVLREQLLNEK